MLAVYAGLGEPGPPPTNTGYKRPKKSSQRWVPELY